MYSVYWQRSSGERLSALIKEKYSNWKEVSFFLWDIKERSSGLINEVVNGNQRNNQPSSGVRTELLSLGSSIPSSWCLVAVQVSFMFFSSEGTIWNEVQMSCSSGDWLPLLLAVSDHCLLITTIVWAKLVDVNANRTHCILSSQITPWEGNVREYAHAQMRSITALLTRFGVLFSHLFSALISPAFCCTSELAESNRCTGECLTSACSVCQCPPTFSLRQYYLDINYVSLVIADFPGHLCVDCEVHQMSSDSLHYPLRLCSENKTVFFLPYITSLVIEIVGFQNSWQFRLIIQEAAMAVQQCSAALLALWCQQLYKMCRAALCGREKFVHRDTSGLLE